MDQRKDKIPIHAKKEKKMKTVFQSQIVNSVYLLTNTTARPQNSMDRGKNNELQRNEK